MNRDWKSDRNMHRNKDQHSLNIINTRIILLVFHLFTVCGAVTLVTPNTATEVTVGEQVLFCVNQQEPVSQPALKIVGDCLTPNIILSCSVSKGTNVTFHWRKESSGAIDGAYNRTDLVIDRGNEQEQHVYRCIAENPIFGSFVPSLFSS
ncbi:uncharacterized protein [Heterodontus francisci]|uniref:uncharacterized protein isoform X2 n=1 Tax=Heterodontus francisci TaxID=7792 RepID=UPI00355B139D